jgi:Protein of unknown function (DUF3253)
VSELEDAISRLLEERGPDKTICPSEAARAVGGERWRDLMPGAREAAARMANRGELVVTQRGEPVDPLAARGPIRLARRVSSGSKQPQ